MQNLMALNKMTSMQIAEVTGKLHKNILADIRDEAEKLENGGLSGELKFQPSTYTTEQNKVMPCYELTKEGVLQLAARYDAVVRAKLIEAVMKQEQQPQITQLSPELQLFKQMFDAVAKAQIENAETKQIALTATSTANEVKQELQDIRDVMTLDTRSWRKDTSALINKMASKAGGYQHIEAIRKESYRLFTERMNVNLEIRLTNIKKEAALNGMTQAKLKQFNYLDAIEKDKRLVEGYIAIVKEMAVKCGIDKKSA